MTTTKDWADWTLIVGKGKGVVTVSWKLGEVSLTVRSPEHEYITIPLDTIQADAIASTLFRAAIHETDEPT